MLGQAGWWDMQQPLTAPLSPQVTPKHDDVLPPRQGPVPQAGAPEPPEQRRLPRGRRRLSRLRGWRLSQLRRRRMPRLRWRLSQLRRRQLSRLRWRQRELPQLRWLRLPREATGPVPAAPAAAGLPGDLAEAEVRGWPTRPGSASKGHTGTGSLQPPQSFASPGAARLQTLSSALQDQRSLGKGHHLSFPAASARCTTPCSGPMRCP